MSFLVWPLIPLLMCLGILLFNIYGMAQYKVCRVVGGIKFVISKETLGVYIISKDAPRLYMFRRNIVSAWELRRERYDGHQYTSDPVIDTFPVCSRKKALQHFRLYIIEHFLNVPENETKDDLLEKYIND